MKKALLLAVLCAAPAAAQAPIEGKVLETMDSGNYTYARVAQGEGSAWVAVPKMKLKVGDKAAFEPGMTMTDFKSPTLNRTFKEIIFSGGPVGGAKHKGAAKAAKDASAKTPKADGPNAYTVAEVYAKRAELSGKEVAVRGKVVKVNRGIMDRNWVHLQDGSGDAKAGTVDLLITTTEDAKVGDVVTARGTAAKDQDFGMGYSYKVLLEKAKLGRDL